VRPPITLTAVILTLGLASIPTVAPAQTAAVAYVQATVVEPKPGDGSLDFVTASGRPKTARVRGRALAGLPNLQPGDEVILTLEGPAERPVVTSMKVSRVAPAPPPVETLASPYAWTTTVSSRPSWPNPYSRINPGLPLRPARAARVRGGTLSVMPVALSAGVPAQPPPVAAPAVLAPANPVPPSVRVRAEASTVDAVRQRGVRDFEAAVSRFAAEARAIDSVYARYRAACPPSGASEDGSRPWFELWNGTAVTESGSACAPMLDEIARLGTPIRAGMLAAHEAARSAWVLPGTMRDIERRHSMEWSGWDR
jgi:hypothetical protein